MFELLVQPRVLELCILNQFSRILLEEDDDHTNDVDHDDDDDDDDENQNDVDDTDDNDPVKFFQTHGKWWELIVYLLTFSLNITQM